MVLTLVNVLREHLTVYLVASMIHPNTLAASIQWSAPLGMCIATKSSHILVAVWASPVRLRLRA